MTAATPPDAKSASKGYVITFIDAVVFSTTGIFIRYLTETYQMPPLVLAFWRNVFVVLALIPALFLLRRRLLKLPARHLGYMVAFGLVLALYNTMWTYSVALTGAALATVLTYTSGAFTALMGRWLLKEPLYLGKWLAILLSFSGVILVSGVWGDALVQADLGGVLLGAFSGLLYSVYSLMGRSASQRGINPWTNLLYTFGFATFFLLGINLAAAPTPAQGATDLLWLGDATHGWLMLVILAVGPTLAGYGLYNVGLVYLPSSIANLILTLEPLFTTLIAYIFLHERLTGMEIFGSLLILAGVVVLRLRSKGKKPSQIPPATI